MSRTSFLLLLSFFFFMLRRPPRSTLFPYTTSSDLPAEVLPARTMAPDGVTATPVADVPANWSMHELGFNEQMADRKSTRLNSSHRCISYAVFCLKKKKNKKYKYKNKNRTGHSS